MNLGTASSGETDTKGLAKPFLVAGAMAKAKCVDASPSIIEGGYSPMTARSVADLDS
jgi:hypothetical protein